MANAILTKTDAVALFTITVAGLASGASRQSDMIANSSNRPAAIIPIKITTGAVAPVAGGVYTVHLIRASAASSPDYRSDGAGASDAAITMENARFLGAIVVTASAAKAFYAEFDTSPLGPLGPSWGIIIRNATSQAASTTESDHYKGYLYYYPELQ